MTAIPFAFAAYKRSGFPETRTVNVLVEKAPTKGAQPLAFISRPGLEPLELVGTAPIRCMFAKSGLLNGAAFIVAETGAYTLSASGAVSTLSGTIPGDALVDVAGGFNADGDTVIRVANTDALYKVVGGVVTQEDFPESSGVTSVEFYKGYWLAVEANSAFLYHINPAEDAWNALQFDGADYGPDRLVAVRAFGDVFALLGEATTEVWYADGSGLAPYGSLNFDFGCRSRAAAVNCQGALIWVDNNCSVRFCEGGDARLISDNGLAEQIRRVSAMDLRASFFVKDQHPCYVLTLGDEATWVYDLSTQAWTQADSRDRDFWRAHLFCNLGDDALAADALSNQVWKLDPDRRTDGSDTFTVRFPAYLEVTEGTAPVANIQMDCLTGDVPLEGQGSDPLIIMRMSRDGTKTYGPPKEKSLGTTGIYAKTVKWSSLGEAKAPHGIWFDFAISDPVGRRFSGLRLNAP